MSRISLRSMALAAPAAFALALAASPPATAVQRNVTIYQIQDTTAVGHVVAGSTDTVTFTGVLTASDTRSAFGFAIQDPAGGPYSGVMVIASNNIVADSGYVRGDLITVTGRVNEFNSVETQVLGRNGGSPFGNPPPTTTKIGTAPLPPAIALPNYGAFAELAAYQFGERYEGVRVSLTNGRNQRLLFPETWLVTDNNAPGSTDTVRVDGFTLCWPNVVTAPAVGVVATFFQGIGGQTARGYGINLRDIADITVPSPPSLLNGWATTNNNIRLLFDRPLDPATAQNPANYSRATLGAIDAATLVGGAGSQTVDLTTTTDPQVPAEAEQVTASGIKSSLGVAMTVDGIQAFRAGVTPIRLVQTNAVEDTSQFANEQVTVRGVIHARDEGNYYIQDATLTNPSSAMVVFGAIQSLDVGDDVTVSGTIIEFGAASQMTEYTNISYQNVHASGVAKFPAVVVPPGQIGALTGSEPYPGERYEGMFVQLNNTTVVQDSLPNGQFLVRGAGGAGDTVRVDDVMFRHPYLYAHGADHSTVVPFLRGVVADGFGQYTVLPRDSADISDQLVGVEPGPSAMDFAIRSFAPTPVSFARGGVTQLRFTMPTAGRVSARVFDLAGRLVAQPFSDREFDAGPQSVALNANSLGGRVGSGIFFIQLQLENRVATAKLVVTD
jgi:hypothetical protein